MDETIPPIIKQMLVSVADALGEELLPRVAFVGGSTTALLISDPITRQAVRFTEDVDVIFSVDGPAAWQIMQQKLKFLSQKSLI